MDDNNKNERFMDRVTMKPEEFVLHKNGENIKTRKEILEDMLSRLKKAKKQQKVNDEFNELSNSDTDVPLNR